MSRLIPINSADKYPRSTEATWARTSTLDMNKRRRTENAEHAAPYFALVRFGLVWFGLLRFTLVWFWLVFCHHCSCFCWCCILLAIVVGKVAGNGATNMANQAFSKNLCTVGSMYYKYRHNRGTKCMKIAINKMPE